MYFCRPSRWLWGLIPLALIGILVAFSLKDNIEKDLQSRAQSALSESGLSWAIPAFDGRDGIISGNSGVQDEQLKALKIVGSLRGVRVVEDRATVLPNVKPFFWGANRKGGRVKLKGHVPSEEDRKAILGIARANFPGLELDDRMKLANGAPPRATWLGGVSFGLKQLSGLKRGGIRLEDEQFSINGEAVDTRRYKAITIALSKKNMPSGVVLKRNEIRLPKADPFIWKARYDGSSIVLSGYAPSEVARKKVSRHARRMFGEAALVDRMTLASGANKGWAKAAIAVLDQMPRLQNGRAELSGKILTFVGLTTDKNVAKNIENSLRSELPPVFKGKEKISVKAQIARVLPNINPYRWSANRSNGVLTLTGYVPNNRMRAAVINFAKDSIVDHRIVDNMKLGNGEHEEAVWIGRIRFGLRMLSRFSFGDVGLVDSDLSIKGEAASVTNYQEVMSDLEAPISNGLAFKNVTVVPARVSPYILTVTLETSALSLVGYVPDHESRKAVKNAIDAAYSDILLDNRLALASGAPDQWRSAVLSGLKLLAKLHQGKLSLKGNTVSIEGIASDDAIAESVRHELTNDFVDGYQKDSAIEVAKKSRPEPVVESPKSESLPTTETTPREGRGDKSETAAQVKEARLAPAPRARNFAESQTAEIDVPDVKQDRLTANKIELAVVARAKAEEPPVKPKSIKLKSIKRTNEAELRQTAAIKPRLQFDECQRVLNSELTKGSIIFKRRSSNLREDSKPLLRRLADIADRCPKSRIEITGHTDSDGRQNFNKSLSLKRAETVRRFLIDAGIPEQRLSATGYGENLPKVPDTTLKNKAKNRHIEFNVRG